MCVGLDGGLGPQKPGNVYCGLDIGSNPNSGRPTNKYSGGSFGLDVGPIGSIGSGLNSFRRQEY